MHTKMILRNFVSLRAFTVYMENSLQFEIWPKWNFHEMSFTLPEIMWTLVMKLPYTEVKFYPKVKFQTSLSSLWVSCKRAHREFFDTVFFILTLSYFRVFFN